MRVICVTLVILCIFTSCTAKDSEIGISAELDELEKCLDSLSDEDFSVTLELYVYAVQKMVQFHTYPETEYVYSLFYSQEKYETSMREWEKSEKQAYFSEGILVQARLVDASADESEGHRVVWFFLTDNFTSLDSGEITDCDLLMLPNVEVGDKLTCHMSNIRSYFWIDWGTADPFYVSVLEDEEGNRAIVHAKSEYVVSPRTAEL